MIKRLTDFLNKIFAPRVTYFYNDKKVSSNHPEMKRAKEAFKRAEEAFKRFDKIWEDL